MKVVREVPLPMILKERLDALELNARRAKEAVENALAQINLVRDSLDKSHYNYSFSWDIPGDKEGISIAWRDNNYSTPRFELWLTYPHRTGGNSTHWSTIFSDIKNDELLLKYSPYLADFVEAFINHSNSLIEAKKSIGK